MKRMKKGKRDCCIILILMHTVIRALSINIITGGIKHVWSMFLWELLKSKSITPALLWHLKSSIFVHLFMNLLTRTKNFNPKCLQNVSSKFFLPEFDQLYPHFLCSTLRLRGGSQSQACTGGLEQGRQRGTGRLVGGHGKVMRVEIGILHPAKQTWQWKT